jgi:GH15 family glucan-1,4-alpha-glucosidase
MAWVAADRSVKTIEQFGREGPVERWRKLRDTIHAEVCTKGFDERLNSFVQHYGSQEVDASLLMLPMVGFLPPDDHRIVGTVEAVQKRLMREGFLLRYETRSGVDGLPPGEGVFLLCNFWLVDNLILQGRIAEAVKLFERMISLRNDVGLLSEEYDPRTKRFLGNFPQAFSHVALVNSAVKLSKALGDQPIPKPTAARS